MVAAPYFRLKRFCVFDVDFKHIGEAGYKGEFRLLRGGLLSEQFLHICLNILFLRYNFHWSSCLLTIPPPPIHISLRLMLAFLTGQSGKTIHRITFFDPRFNRCLRPAIDGTTFPMRNIDPSPLARGLLKTCSKSARRFRSQSRDLR